MTTHTGKSGRVPVTVTFLFLVCSLLPATGFSAEQGKGLLAGTAIVDITPKEWPLVLKGSFFPRPATSAHDPLNVRALAFQNGEGRAVIVIVDTLGLSREVIDPVKKRAAEATGWRTDQMLIAATHTHSAPSTHTNGKPPQVAYGKLAQDGMVKAIVQAVKNLQPASVGFGSDSVPEEVFNRRWYLQDGKMPPNPFGGMDKVKMNPNRNHITEPAGPTDPEVSVIHVRNARRKPLGLLANYSLHYVGHINLGERQASADYFGEYARVMPWRLRAAASEDFVAMLSNGACGDINNIDFNGTRAPREPFEQIRIVAAKVADASWRAIRDMEYFSDASVAMRQREVPIDWRMPSKALLERSEKILAMTAEQQAELPRLEPLYARRVVNQSKRTGKADCLVQAIRIGDQAIVTLPFETFVEIGLEIKEKSPFRHNLVIELANGSYGYLPTPKHHQLGGYETWLGTSKVRKDASDILTRNLLEMLEELHTSSGK
jgi:neutral ceramidase